MPSLRRILPFGLLALTALSLPPKGDDLDAFIEREMALRKVPGLSLAIIQDGRIVAARAYGVTEQGGTPVTPATLFQAGSISKPVAAVGALTLVEAGRLTLDEDVNRLLTSWKVPGNRFTEAKPVTLRGILSHGAGLTVHGFPGYDRTDPYPSLVQVLDGTPPANTSAIRVDTTPGAILRYSGGGYTVMQQLVVDVTGKPFPEFMQQAVLGPLGMTRSSYQQPPLERFAASTAAGHDRDRRAVRGRWHLYPEMAAAGLWTTPFDLARFAVGVQQAFAGKPEAVLSAAMTRQLLTTQMGDYGLGLALRGAGPTLSFGHGGRDEGFDALLTAFAETGQGAVVMINANDNSGMMRRILSFIGRKYAWPDAIPAATPVTAAVAIPTERLAALTGRYEIANNQMLTLVASGGRLRTMSDGLPDEEFVALGEREFASTSGDIRLSFSANPSDSAALTWTEGSRVRKAPRVGPLVSSLTVVADPDSAATEEVEAALRVLVAGGDALRQATYLTAGARADLAGYTVPGMVGNTLTYVNAEEVEGRGLERHGAAVSRIVYYRYGTAEGNSFLMVHRTADGRITDFDIADD